MELSKEQYLYSIRDINASTRPIIVEGIFDAMWLHQVNWGNTYVALITAMASKTQIEKLKAFEEVILFLDNDKAGKQATNYLAQVLRSSTKVSVVDYPSNKKDPAELTSDEIKDSIAHRLTYVEYSYIR